MIKLVNMSFQQKMETFQYNSALSITGAIRVSSRGKSIHPADTTLEIIYNYSGKCAMPSRKIGGWFSSIELFKKVKNTESTIVGLRESSRRYDRDFKTFLTIARYLKISDLETALVGNTTTNWYGKHTEMAWEDSRQIFSTSKQSKPGMSSQNQSYMPSLSTHLKNKLHEAWKDLRIKFYE